MTRRLFRNGGPLSAKYLGNSQYNLSISLPTDRDGRYAKDLVLREAHVGTGLTGRAEAYCPYCRQHASGNDFATQEQAAGTRVPCGGLLAGVLQSEIRHTRHDA
jgi:hypothetical protein